MANIQNLKPFKPGQSGNPKGRVKGGKTVSTRLAAFLNAKYESKNPFTGEREKLEVADWLALSLIKNALTSKTPVPALKEILERMEGKVAHLINQNTNLNLENIDLSALSESQLIQVLEDNKDDES